MTLRKYLFSIALLFLIPAVALAAMGNGLAWAFGIIAGMLALGGLAGDESAHLDENGEDPLGDDRYTHPYSPQYAGVPIIEDARTTAIDDSPFT